MSKPTSSPERIGFLAGIELANFRVRHVDDELMPLAATAMGWFPKSMAILCRSKNLMPGSRLNPIRVRKEAIDYFGESALIWDYIDRYFSYVWVVVPTPRVSMLIEYQREHWVLFSSMSNDELQTKFEVLRKVFEIDGLHEQVLHLLALTNACCRRWPGTPYIMQVFHRVSD